MTEVRRSPITLPSSSLSDQQGFIERVGDAVVISDAGESKAATVLQDVVANQLEASFVVALLLPLSLV